MPLGAVALGAFASLTDTRGPQPFVPASGVASIAALVLAVVGIVIILRRRAWRGFRKRLREKLQTTYPSTDEAMLLVDVVTMSDWRTPASQGALIGVRDGELIAFGECDETRIPVGSITGLVVQREGGSRIVPAELTVCYTVDDIPQWLSIRPMGRSEKGLPRNAEQLRAWLDDRLTGAGAELTNASRDRKWPNACRLAVGTAILAGVAGLTWFWTRVLNLADSGWPVVAFAAVVVGRHLWQWANTTASRPEGTPPEET